MNWSYRGRCWKFGDNLGIDGDIMPLRFALERETDPMVLRDFLMHEIDPEFAKKVAPGDIIVGGKRFGQGNPHIQGFLGIRGHGLGLVAESIPRGSFRNAINAGLPFLSGCEGVTQRCETGDELEVDFQTGTFKNITRGTRTDYAPLPAELLAIVAVGGWKEHFRRRLAVGEASGSGPFR
jgi:3-isopropylmalate/(R)-2-methylmalate dehydratase small subunit